MQFLEGWTGAMPSGYSVCGLIHRARPAQVISTDSKGKQ